MILILAFEIHHWGFLEFFFSRLSMICSFDISGCLFAKLLMNLSSCSLSGLIGLLGFSTYSSNTSAFVVFQ